jgi:cell wall-associated NlpC family hydrolase
MNRPTGPKRCRASLTAALLCAAAIPLTVPALADARFGDETLRRGDTGADVRGLQRTLTRAGYETGVDGQFGRQTYRNVRAFESAEDRRVDGKVTPSDATALKTAAQESGDSPQDEPTTGRATLDDEGMAVAPSDAPAEVKAAIEAANEIATAPYKYGGGHGSRMRDSGYDCSGSISYALRKAGLMKSAMSSGAMTRYGSAGRGDWITVYANSGHAYMVIAGLRFDTSARKRDGNRWTTRPRSRSGYVARHPDGF